MTTPTLSESCVCGANIRITSPDRDECEHRIAAFNRDHARCTAGDDQTTTKDEDA